MAMGFRSPLPLAFAVPSRPAAAARNSERSLSRRDSVTATATPSTRTRGRKSRVSKTPKIEALVRVSRSADV